MPAQRALHAAHLLTFVTLLATGLLLLFPELRASLIGGYSLVVRSVHCWVGVAFVVLPAALLAAGGLGALAAAPTAVALRALWRRLHVWATVLLGALFTVTGAILWADADVSELIHDGSRATHNWLTWAGTGLLGVHLLELAAARLGERVTARDVRRVPGA